MPPLKTFPASEYYQAAPHFKRIPGSIDFTVIYQTKNSHLARLSLSLHTIQTFRAKKWTTRYARGFLNFTDASIPIPKLHGISALGTRFCVYECSTPLRRSLTPLRIDPPPDFVTDTAPKERWNLRTAGRSQIETTLKEMVAGLPCELGFFDTASTEI